MQVMIDPPADTAWYVFGVAEDDPGLARLDGVELIRHGALAAVAQEVSPHECDEEVPPERLDDHEWLEREVQVREDVLLAAATATAVVPLRFGTIYRSREHVERMLEERSNELSETLDRIRGHVELGVRAWVDLTALERTFGAEGEPAVGGAGAAYLRQRRLERELTARCLQLAEEAHGRLALVAAAAVANRPQPRELTGRSDTMVLNGAYLVPYGDERLPGVVASLEQAQAPLGVEYEVTGPRPPRNFAGERE